MFLKTYLKVRKVFRPPKFRFFIGKWKNEPNLPVWRRGNTIKFIKNSYTLPIWLSFYIFNHDIWYKTKWEADDYIYEFPANLTLVFFGLAISITAEEESFYWESMLMYLHYKGDIEKACDRMGIWTKSSTNEQFFGFNPDYLKDTKLRNQLIRYQTNYHDKERT
jgi:hypothetical protein